MRCFLPLIATFCLALAPLPFPKGGRPAPRDLLRDLRGAWKVLSLEGDDSTGGKGLAYLHANRVRFEGDRLTYLIADEPVDWSRVEVDAAKEPAHIDFYARGSKPGKPDLVGIIRLEGDRALLLFCPTAPRNRVKSFDSPPPPWRLAVLERE